MSSALVKSITQKLFEDIRLEESELTGELIERIIKDVDVSSALNKIRRNVAGRELKLYSIDKEADIATIESRFYDLKLNRILNHLITARYFGYALFEKVYNEDFSLKSLVPIPYKYVVYKDNKWILKVGSEEREINYLKYLLCINEWNPAEPKGKSILEDIRISFLDKDLLKKQMRRVAEKYGDVITVVAVDQRNTNEENEEVAKEMALVQGRDVVTVPIGNGVTLSDTIMHIRLSDLEPKIYTELEALEKEKIVQNILGSTLTMEASGKEGTGSRALGEVHQIGFQDVVQENCNFCADSLYQLIKDDSNFFGYDPKKYYWQLDKVLTKKELQEEKEREEKNKSLQLDNIKKVSELGYEIDLEIVSNVLGINSHQIVKKPQIQPLALSEFSKNSNKNIVNLKLQTAYELEEKFNEYLIDSSERFSSYISEQITNQLENFKEGDLEFRFNLDYGPLEDDMIISNLKGYLNSKTITTLIKTEEFNPFSLPFEEAIKSFNDKTPILYETIEQMTEEVRANFNWLKKSNDLEVTDKIFKSLKKNLENGETFEQWKKDSANHINKLGLGDNGHYLDVVYRTNIQSQYSIGHYKQQMEVVKEYPYWKYTIVGDDRTSDICNSLANTIKRYDNSFWNMYYPPNHYRCRSMVISLSKSDLEESGLTLTTKKFDLDVGTFKGNPGKTYWKNVSKLSKEKQENLTLWE